MPINSPRGAFDALYVEFLERGIRYCFPGVNLQRSASEASASEATRVEQFSVTPRPDGAVDLTWLDTAWRMDRMRSRNRSPSPHRRIRLISGRETCCSDRSKYGTPVARMASTRASSRVEG